MKITWSRGMWTGWLISFVILLAIPGDQGLVFGIIWIYFWMILGAWIGHKIESQ